ncbi:hypothetical protein AWZ03_002432 [Drosophila navojoa]|uniref:Uncharacterized protein n=1 Tax=Drosophila navojoa TaxID=7232 RepID=A0A484BQH8_DRONA|nr:uncharacterized protein LOC108652840 [Drosophila navojoa]TDG51069.1 hypothetical protein AWZ03_002432 [Drosophila navojoa]
MSRLLIMIGLLALGVCLASALPAQPFVDHSNGKETSIPGTTTPEDSQPAQRVPNVLYNRAGNVVLQNEAGTIYKRPDGRTVLIGANGQTLVTRSDESDEDTSIDDDDDQFRRQKGNRGNSGNIFISQAGGSGIQTYNGYRSELVDGGLRLTVNGFTYNFPAKDASVNSKQQIKINGENATLQYDNGNIVVEMADGTVIGKAEGGLFTGNRHSYDNRKKIQEELAANIATLQYNLSHLQDNIARQINQIGINLNNFPF